LNVWPKHFLSTGRGEAAHLGSEDKRDGGGGAGEHEEADDEKGGVSLCGGVVVVSLYGGV